MKVPCWHLNQVVEVRAEIQQSEHMQELLQLSTVRNCQKCSATWPKVCHSFRQCLRKLYRHRPITAFWLVFSTFLYEKFCFGIDHYVTGVGKSWCANVVSQTLLQTPIMNAPTNFEANVMCCVPRNCRKVQVRQRDGWMAGQGHCYVSIVREK